MPYQNDYELIYYVREFSDDARVDIFEKYKPIIVSIASKYISKVGKGADIDDLIQEGYIGLNNAIENFKENYNTLFYTFACLCIERQIQTFCRKQHGKKQEIFNQAYFFDDLQIDTTMIADNKIDYLCEESYLEKIINFKNSLSLEQALVFELRYNGFTYKEISILLELTIKKVDSLLFQVRTKLKRENFKQTLFD